MINSIIQNLPANAKILDYGCLGWDVCMKYSQVREDVLHFGADVKKPDVIPSNAEFYYIDKHSSKIDAKDDFFDLIVASHVIEHIIDPLKFFAELVRVCKPGGLIFIEAPSDKACFVKSDRNYLSNNFFSFWDDPTHIRPWTPAAFYRLGLSYGIGVLETDYIGGLKDALLWPIIFVIHKIFPIYKDMTPFLWAGKGWACFAVYQKPQNVSGCPDYKYTSLKPHKHY